MKDKSASGWTFILSHPRESRLKTEKMSLRGAEKYCKQLRDGDYKLKIMVEAKFEVHP